MKLSTDKVNALILEEEETAEAIWEYYYNKWGFLYDYDSPDL